MMKFSPRRTVLLLVLAVLVAMPSVAAKPSVAKPAAARPAVDPALFGAVKWREVGPYRGGRSAAVTGLPGDRNTYYFGATGGGVWKTTDGGRTWRNVSDGFYGGSIGAVAVSEWDPNVVYVGGGEVTVRGNVSHGEGMWKSTDAGQTWKLAGLADSRHIPRVRIHPKNPDLVYAAVLGHLFGPNEMRGVYRSKDGGAHWERVLYVSDRAGAVDLAMDPVNPRVLYATTWNVRRTPYSLESGGPGSGIWKSTDGGDTWTELSRHPGLPKGTLGIIGITVSPTNPENVYALVEAEEGGVFRSRDGGKTWTKTNDDRNLRQRAWYYTRIYADPKDEEAVYVLNVQFHRSKDGGKSFTTIRVPHGDNHDLWIDPNDALRLIESNDGGANVSTDGGSTWSPQTNQPTAQFYRVSTDTNFPYRVLGAQQDNSAVRILSRGTGPGIGPGDWQETAGGESGYIVADPTNPDVVFGGSYGGLLTRLNHDTGELRDVNPWPNDPMGAGAAELQYRFQWNFPIFFSPNDPKTLYSAANVLFKSTDAGQSWQPISPDLTRNDKSRLGSSGGPITKDNTSVEYYGTIFYAAESPLEPGLLWAGSDDGLVHVSRDGGKNWSNVTPKGMPEWIQINAIDASPHDKGGAYVAATMYKSDDFRPYLYKTGDYGATWKRIDAGIDPMHFTRVVRADPARKGLLYAGTEQGAYVSFDDGNRWQPLQLNLPIVPVTDLTVKDGDLVAATQGRGFWVLDGLGPVREAAASQEATKGAAKPFLLPPAPSHRRSNRGFSLPRTPQGMGENPPAGVVIQYYLPKDYLPKDYLPKAPPAEQAKQVKLEILTQDGKVIRTFEGKPAEGPKDPAEARAMGGPAAGEKAEKEEKTVAATPSGESSVSGPQGAKDKGGEAEKEKDDEEPKEEQKVPTEAGLNRFVWDMAWPAASKFPGMILWSGEPAGPLAVPGSYQARLTAGGGTFTQPFEIRKDPRSASTQADLEAQFQFLLSARDKLTETHDAIRRIRDVRAQLDGMKKRLRKDEAMKPVVEAAKELDKKMTVVEEALYQTKNRSSQDPLNFPIRLNDKLNAVASSASLGDYRPTAQAVQVKNELTAAIDAQLAALRGIWDGDLARFNELAREKGVAAVIVPPARLK
ncbi:MAG TPA: glycosyl hydrolase [Thermoanaerobaculia bacterium]|nr:glycosyl hydrolase [Thermoanaerobaculia bacterium]